MKSKACRWLFLILSFQILMNCSQESLRVQPNQGEQCVTPQKVEREATGVQKSLILSSHLLIIGGLYYVIIITAAKGVLEGYALMITGGVILENLSHEVNCETRSKLPLVEMTQRKLQTVHYFSEI